MFHMQIQILHHQQGRQIRQWGPPAPSQQTQLNPGEHENQAV